MNTTPIIGIVAKRLPEEGKRTDFRIREEMVNALVDNGALVIGIMPSKSDKFVDIEYCFEDMTEEAKCDLYSLVDICDGIVFEGGSISEKYEPIIAKYTFEKDIPTLGICAGQNNMARALGGKVRKLENNNHMKIWEEYVHSIDIDKTSKFYSIVKTTEMKVNSRHFNVVDEFPGYLVAAKDEEGNVEVIEAKDKLFNIAMRFHPESLYKTDEKHTAIFKAFIDACIKYKNLK